MSVAATSPGSLDNSGFIRSEASPNIQALDTILSVLGSQKIAIATFAYGIFVILVGTLAQTEKDIWQVVPEYFRSVVMWVDINLFFPPSFFPSWKRLNVPLIPAPGGMVVGVTMIANIVFAHLRWLLQLKTKTLPLLGGLALVALGWLVTLLIILNGHNRGGFQAQPPFTWQQFWVAFQLVVLATWVCALFGYVWFILQPAVNSLRERNLTWFRTAFATILLAAIGGYTQFAWFVLFGMEYPGPEMLRIMWQLAQGTIAGGILLGGSVLVFQKRGGVVLLHQGLLLLMLNELIVARYAVEYQMRLIEGETKNYLSDSRATELAIIDRSKSEVDQHTVIPGVILQANARQNAELLKEKKQPKPIDDPENKLPVNVTVVRYLRNAELRPLDKGAENPATAGIGLKQMAKEVPIAKGTDTDSAVDLAATYVKFTDKKTGADLGTHLLAQTVSSEFAPITELEEIKVGDQPYLISLRFQRQYVPFTVHLKDVKRNDYIGTNTPQNYSSDIVLKDKESGVDSEVHIKMNDPLRYSGLTLYQSGYTPLGDGLEMTSLAVVKNTGFLIPYVSLMIITVGMVAHFLMTLTRFLRRRETEELTTGSIVVAELSPELSTIQAAKNEPKRKGPPIVVKKPPSNFESALKGYSIAMAAATLIWLILSYWSMRTPTPKPDQLDWEAFGRIPVASGGRVMPLDTVARNALLQLRQRETAKTKEGKTIPATQWILDLMTRSPNALTNRVFKIDNPDIKKILQLEERPGHLYSTEDLLKHHKDFEKQVAVAREKREKKEDLTILQRRMLVLEGQMTQYMLLFRAFGFPDLPPFPKEGDSPEVQQQKMLDLRMAMMESAQALKRGNPPLLIPLAEADAADGQHWITLNQALTIWRIETQLQGTKGDPVADSFVKIMSAYLDYAQAADALKAAREKKEPEAKLKTLQADVQRAVDPFNTAVSRYLSQVQRIQPQGYSEDKIKLETWMNRVSPFYVCMELYVIAFLITLAGWLLPSKKINWAAFTLIVLTFGLHTAALWMRIEISGRPPVTNLYSSAVFIGWGCVLLGIIVEMIYRIGLGNMEASVAGFSSLIIAYFLSMSGDTIGVMQAVLDTQFWLATHVVCITLGYTATYVAGLLGVAFVVLGVATPRLDAVSRRNLGRMIYGITCFAMFFSFFGTVLGGLWADDSWGRFWGWDPKENGALIIVLWNALILHARWDKLVKDRGLALLAIGGNIVTSWSWFGVNELGIGLHSYGFTEGVLLALGAFVLSQIMLIIVGLIPLKHWWSVNSESSGITNAVS